MWCSSAVNRTLLLCRAARRTATSPFDAVSRRSVRAAAVLPSFPSGEVLSSAASAEGEPSLFGCFIGLIPSSDFSSTRFAAPYPAHGLPCERFRLSLAASPCITRGRGGWLGLTPWKTYTSYPLPA